MRVEYHSNNSGGSWWLDDDDWKALEAAGWKVEWAASNEILGQKQERWLGALATTASREGLSLQDAVAEWEKATGETSTDAGCACCGQPHNFTLYDDDGKYIDSGPNVDYTASW
jgi:hypothetical protein